MLRERCSVRPCSMRRRQAPYAPTIELLAGNPARVVRLVSEASAARGATPLRDGYGEWLESSALLALGNADAALPVSMRSVDDLRTAENQPSWEHRCASTRRRHRGPTTGARPSKLSMKQLNCFRAMACRTHAPMRFGRGPLS